jgi:hypothetical protein
MQLADHLAEGGILAAYRVDIGHAQLFKWDNEALSEPGFVARALRRSCVVHQNSPKM